MVSWVAASNAAASAACFLPSARITIPVKQPQIPISSDLVTFSLRKK